MSGVKLPQQNWLFSQSFTQRQKRVCYTPRFYPRSTKKITQIYLPYLWHFTTLTKPHSVMASLQKSLQSPISIWWIVNFVPKCFLLFLWPFKSSPLNGWHDGLWILEGRTKRPQGFSKSQTDCKIYWFIFFVFWHNIGFFSFSKSKSLIDCKKYWFILFFVYWLITYIQFSFFVSLCHVCGFCIKEKKI